MDALAGFRSWHGRRLDSNSTELHTFFYIVFNFVVAIVVFNILLFCYQRYCKKGRSWWPGKRGLNSVSAATELAQWGRGMEGQIANSAPASFVAGPDRVGSFHSCAMIDNQDPLQEDIPRASVGANKPQWALVPELHAPPTVPTDGRMAQYMWLHELLRKIAVGEAGQLNAVDALRGENTTPFMVVAGTCPNKFPPAPMQALLFSIGRSGSTDFWWVKPKGSDCAWETINRNMTGTWKNNAEKGTKTYQPIVDLFQKSKGTTKGSLTYGVDEHNRAFIEELRPGGTRWRNIVYLTYVEEWSAMTQKIKGRMLYQRVSVDDPEGEAPRLCSRPYLIKGDDMKFGNPGEEQVISALMC